MSSNPDDDQRDPQQQSPPAPVSLEQLSEFGVLHFNVDADKCVVSSRRSACRTPALRTRPPALANS